MADSGFLRRGCELAKTLHENERMLNVCRKIAAVKMLLCKLGSGKGDRGRVKSGLYLPNLDFDDIIENKGPKIHVFLN